MIEAAFEDLAVKHELFRVLEAVVRDDAILATNTSALSVTEIASVLERPERAVGMHFFNPAPLMPLVEIVRAERTADDVFEAAFELGAKLGKTPIRCSDTPGFVVNRVLIPLLNDCVRVLDEAGVTPEALDAGHAVRRGVADGPVRAARPRRRRRARARERGAVREAARAAHGAARASSGCCRPASSAARPARASTPITSLAAAGRPAAGLRLGADGDVPGLPPDPARR